MSSGDRQWRWVRDSLRMRILVIVIFAAVMPLVIVGVWMSSRLAVAGERLVREQLTTALQDADAALAQRWELRRGELMLLAQNSVVRSALASQQPPDAAGAKYLERAYLQLADIIDGVSYRDADGATAWRIRQDPGGTVRVESGAPSTISRLPGIGVLPVDLTVNDNGRNIGTMTAYLRLGAVLPTYIMSAGPDSRFELLEGGTRRSLLPANHDSAGAAGAITIERASAALPVIFVASASPARVITPFQKQARNASLLLMLVAVASIVIAAWLTAGAMQSLHRLADAADAVARGDLDRQVEAGGASEIRSVSAAFNSMTGRLRTTIAESARTQSLAAVGEFASELAHEIRNPLSSLRLDLQHVEEQLPPGSNLEVPVRRALSIVERLNRTATGALRIARGSHAVQSRLMLTDVIDAAVDSVRPQLDARGIALDRDDAAINSVTVLGDEDALTQLVLNVLMNAVEAIGEDGVIAVSGERAPGSITILVTDSGPGIPAEVLSGIGERFHTMKRGGSGLGVPIARRIAAAHGGTLELDTVAGVGTRVRITLPALA